MDYNSNDDVRKLLRKIMCLNLLTRGTIRSEYELLKAPFQNKCELTEDTHWKLRQFFEYFEDTFLHNDIWKVHEWCLAGLRIRTNSDVDSKFRHYSAFHFLCTENKFMSHEENNISTTFRSFKKGKLS